MARNKCAELIGSSADEIYFTSGGTESNNLALFGTLRGGDSVIVSSIEHSSIMNTCKRLTKRGVDVTYIGVSKGGVVNLKEIEDAITSRTKLISVMSANNEIGTLQPIHKIAEIAHNHNILFHTDAVQAIGHIPISVNDYGIDMLSASGHKFHSLKGTGFLYVRKGIKLNPIICGGSQEHGLRAGTENVCGIVSMGVAAEIVKDKLDKGSMLRVKKIRDYIQKSVMEKIPFTTVNGELDYRLANILSLSFRFVDSGILIDTLSSEGIYVSGKSACTSTDSKPSHVLEAIGLDKCYLNGTIRISLDESMSYTDADYFVDKLVDAVKMLRSYNPLYTGK
jgi:cysteine desulfurase